MQIAGGSIRCPSLIRVGAGKTQAVRVVRFDPAVAMPAGESSLRTTVGPLVGNGVQVRAELVYIAAGGRFVQPDTAQPSLLAVVGGQGAASGSDAMPRTIGAGYGVEWSAGESRCVTTDDGLTGVLVSGAFDLWAMSVTQAIVVVD